MQSILQHNKECFICKTTYSLEEHHVIYGTANRKQSEKYGLKLWLCHKHHNEPPHGAHFNKELDRNLKRYAQIKFEEEYPELDWMEIFGRNYL